MRKALLTVTTLAFGFHASTAALGEIIDDRAVQTGEFQLALTMVELIGPESARSIEEIIPPDEVVTWDIYVPDSYLPDKPAGLMVYISPTPSGKIPRGWKSVMDQRNMIWIAASRSGNKVAVLRRAAYAIIAPTLAGKHYEIDRERIYLSGLSGGGKMASMVASDHPQLFKGAIYNCGVNFWGEQPPRQFELIKRNHYVFVTGTHDQALEPTKKVHRQYRRAGVENSKLMVIRNMSHRNPGSFDFDEALQYLDSRIAVQHSAGAQPIEAER